MKLTNLTNPISFYAEHFSQLSAYAIVTYFNRDRNIGENIIKLYFASNFSHEFF